MSNNLPTGYTQIEYVEFTSGAYIDTTVIPTNHYTELKIDDTSYVNGKHWLGTTSGSQYYHFTEYSNKYYWGTNNSEANGGGWCGGIKILKINYGSNHQVILNDIVLGSDNLITSSANLLIGSSDGWASFSGNIYYCKITDNSTNQLVRNFIPAVRQSDGAIGLFDTVQSVFYGNSGSGSLIASEEPLVKNVLLSKPNNNIILSVNNKTRPVSSDEFRCNVPAVFSQTGSDFQDYVILSDDASGTSGSIPYSAHWIHWASGKKEAWITFTIPSITSTTWGVSKYCDIDITIPTCIGFTSVPKVFGAATQTDKQWWVYNVWDNLKIRFMRPNSSYTSTNEVVAMYCIGE